MFLLGSEDAIGDALACAHAHLQPGGVVVVDVASVGPDERAALADYPEGDLPDLELMTDADDRVVRRTHSVMPRTYNEENNRYLSIAYRYLDASGTVLFERNEEVVLLTPRELLTLFERKGYEITDTFGWYDGRAYSEGERRLIVLARKREQPR